jgi:hypothetical protein
MTTTNEDIFRELGHIKGTLEALVENQHAEDEGCEKDRGKLHKRVRSLEKTRWYATGVVGAIAAGWAWMKNGGQI